MNVDNAVVGRYSRSRCSVSNAAAALSTAARVIGANNPTASVYPEGWVMRRRR